MSDYTLIQNLSIEPMTMPYPLQGVLVGNGTGVVADTPANVAAMFALSGNDVGVIVNLRAVPSSTPATITPTVSVAVTTLAVQTLTNKTLTTPVLTTPTINGATLGGTMVCGSNDITGVGILTSQVVRGAVNNLSLRPAAGGGDVIITKADGTTKSFQSNATGIGFFAAAPAARPAAIGAIGAFTDPPSAGEMAGLRTAVNSLSAALATLGLIAP